MMVKELKKKSNMAALTAAASGVGSGKGGLKAMIAKAKAAKNRVRPHGDEAHTDSGDGVVGSEAAIADEESTADTPVAFKSSPAKIKNVGYNYKPFEMKAKKYNNSPIEKNYGSPAQRGIATPKGLIGGERGKPQADSGPGSGLLYATVGSSPTKGWFSNIGKAVKKVAKKAIDPLGIFKKKKAEEAAAGAGAGAAAGTATGGVAAHSHEPDGTVSGGGAPGGAMGPIIGAAQAAAPVVATEEEAV